MDTVYDAAVVGAGIAGSSTAKALADKGWRVLLIDRQQFPRHKVCGEFLSPESLCSLRSLGLLEAVTSLQPSEIRQVRLILNHGAVIDIPLPGTALGVSRYALDAAIHEAARRSGVDVVTGATAAGLDSIDRRYRIMTKQENGQQLYDVGAVIAAWGANQRAGLLAHGAGGPVNKSYVGIKSHFRGIEMERVVELYFFSGGYMGICPIEGGAVNVAALLTQKAVKDADKSIAGMIAYAASRNERLAERMRAGIPVPGTQKAVAPVDPARKLIAWDSFPHVGDASVMIPPLCGDGMSMALRSAQLCANAGHSYLCGDMTLGDWQREYSAAVEREFSGPLYWGRLLQGLLSVPAMPRMFAAIHGMAPGLTSKLIHLTRLSI